MYCRDRPSANTVQVPPNIQLAKLAELFRVLEEQDQVSSVCHSFFDAGAANECTKLLGTCDDE